MISLVMPTFNRCYNLKQCIGTLTDYMLTLGHPFELILVDDGSTDETPKILRDCCQQYKELKAVVLKNNVGQQNATLAGIRMAKHKRIITLDDDLEYDLRAIPLIIEALESEADVVYVVSKNKGQDKLRSLGTVTKEGMLQWLCHKPKAVTLTSYRGFNGDVAQYIAADRQKHVYISARLLQLHPRIKMIITDYVAQTPLKSTYTMVHLIRLFMRLLLNYGILRGRLSVSKTPQYEIREVYR